MSTSLLYHGWGLKGYHYVRTDYPQGQVIFTVQPAPGTLACPACGCRVRTSRLVGAQGTWSRVELVLQILYERQNPKSRRMNRRRRRRESAFKFSRAKTGNRRVK